MEATFGGTVSGGRGAVSKTHTRQSHPAGGPISHASPPTPFRFWSRRFPQGSRATVEKRTVYPVAGFRSAAGGEGGGVFRAGMGHLPLVYVRAPFAYGKAIST